MAKDKIENGIFSMTAEEWERIPDEELQEKLAGHSKACFAMRVSACMDNIAPDKSLPYPSYYIAFNTDAVIFYNKEYISATGKALTSKDSETVAFTKNNIRSNPFLRHHLQNRL